MSLLVILCLSFWFRMYPRTKESATQRCVTRRFIKKITNLLAHFPLLTFSFHQNHQSIQMYEYTHPKPKLANITLRPDGKMQEGIATDKLFLSSISTVWEIALDAEPDIRLLHVPGCDAALLKSVLFLCTRKSIQDIEYEQSYWFKIYTFAEGHGMVALLKLLQIKLHPSALQSVEELVQCRDFFKRWFPSPDARDKCRKCELLLMQSQNRVKLWSLIKPRVPDDIVDLIELLVHDMETKGRVVSTRDLWYANLSRIAHDYDAKNGTWARYIARRKKDSLPYGNQTYEDFIRLAVNKPECQQILGGLFSRSFAGDVSDRLDRFFDHVKDRSEDF